jgi:hypothetical protein
MPSTQAEAAAAIKAGAAHHRNAASDGAGSRAPIATPAAVTTTNTVISETRPTGTDTR